MTIVTRRCSQLSSVYSSFLPTLLIAQTCFYLFPFKMIRRIYEEKRSRFCLRRITPTHRLLWTNRVKKSCDNTKATSPLPSLASFHSRPYFQSVVNKRMRNKGFFFPFLHPPTYCRLFLGFFSSPHLQLSKATATLEFIRECCLAAPSEPNTGFSPTQLKLLYRIRILLSSGGVSGPADQNIFKRF